MNPEVVTAWAKDMGAKVVYSDEHMATYQFPEQGIVLEFKEKIPFVTFQSSIWEWDNFPSPPPLNVYFTATKEERGRRLDRATMTAPEEAALIMRDPATSFWLRDALWALFKRDPVDALGDAQVLAEIMRKYLDEIQGRSR